MKVAIVTGGCTGIGKAISDKLSDEYVVIRASRRTGYDLTKKDGIEKLVDDVLRQYGRIDVLVNNAGMMPLKNIEETTYEEIDEVLNINLKAVFYLSKLVCQVMEKQEEGGCIVNIASDAGLNESEYSPIYGAAKAGVINLTKSFAHRYAGKINVNSISPGFIDTLLTGEPTPQHLIDEIPVGRIGKPEEVADLVCCVINNKYMTGTNIVLDGGMSTGKRVKNV